MKFSQRHKYIFVEVVCFLYILLFVYAALSKLLDFQNFQTQLGQSPLLSAFTSYISFGVLLMEIMISILLGIPRFRLTALFLAVGLMTMFTAYIIIILNYSSFIPCSCGGILEKLGWHEHLVFNCVFILLGASAILLLNHGKRTLWVLFTTNITAIGILIVLFFTSEDIMARENPFIRRFDQYAIKKIDQTSLQNPSFYMAGSDNGKIYLGNFAAPLQIQVFDTVLKNKKQYTIQLDRDDFPFRSAEVKIHTPYFYLYDGMVPVIYKGKISDWKAEVIYNGKHFFTKAAVIDTNRIAIRGQQKNTGENLMGTLYFNNNVSIKYNPDILEKQIDGIFDTDGTFEYSNGLKRFVYTYYYRNQYIVTDDKLDVYYRGNTIDTTTKAKLKVIKIKLSGDTKLGAPPYMVNKNTAVCNNLLFVNSSLKGRFESEEVWDQASVIDVYDISKNEYVSSFYIYNIGKSKMKYFLVTDSNLYAISGQVLQRFSLGNTIKKAIKK
ncbi:MauE/DoxX family redox-associated membrane protein [Flavobacterium johnsoniae]|uniref:Methylamine utilisation protein MauE domain-containing protein n=1 Tax=Flavobacterium johnsoniae TaxID=986 RepID=A0A1M5UWW2_FLAJO|nr:MauE/DoxX family redox-associated membrane protein [Flavobacterium johnsoniae]SHH67368.1 hypothetical protein SAMN05444388_11514 [Flavobacterium johnsoniae]